MAGDDQAIQLTLLVGLEEEADGEAVDLVAHQLRQELEELPFVEEVGFVRGDPILGGIKGGDALMIGAMTVSFLAGATPALAAALHRWTQRGENQFVKIHAQVGDRTVRLELPAGAMTAEQLQQIMNTLMGAVIEEKETHPAAGMGLARLGRSLDAHFDLGELRLLCADLGIEWENLAGETRLAKAYALVAFCGRSGRLGELVEVCRRERPGIDWKLEIRD
jgi:hypothetical protein